MASMVLNVPVKNWSDDALTPHRIAQAAIKANPDIQFIVPTTESFSSLNDPKFVEVRQKISRALGVPPEQVFPVRAYIAFWPQDEFMAGSGGLIKPSHMDEVNQYRPRQTKNGAGQLARELSLDYYKASFIARGGDTHIVQAPDGRLRAHFSRETIDYTRQAQGIKGPDEFIMALASTMEHLYKSGIRLNDIAPLGFSKSNKTYGDALRNIQPESRKKISPEVLRRLEEMSALPLPEVPFSYHTDVVAFTPNGADMFIPEGSKTSPDSKGKIVGDMSALARQLKFFNYNVSSLPREIFEEKSVPDGPEFEGVRLSGRLETSYLNMIVGKHPTSGQTIILMPTQALDPSKLTTSDKIAMRALKSALPQAVVIPIGGHSALIGSGLFYRGDSAGGVIVSKRDGDWGPHCMSNVLPYTIKKRSY